MLPFRLEKSNCSPFKKGTSPRVDCRNLFPAERHTVTLSPTEDGHSQRNQLLEDARKSTCSIALHGAPLPLAWVLVLDNVIPDYAVPFSEAYGGPQFIARTFLEGHYCIGKAGTGLPFGALITYAGRQVTVKRYEVLCFATQMRWGVTRDREHFQQSSFVVSNTATLSYNSFHTSQTEITASTLLDSDILRVIPDNGMHYARSTINERGCTSPLSPIDRRVIEEICSSANIETDSARKWTSQFAQSSPFSVPPTHHEDGVARESLSAEFASTALRGHSCSRTCGCGSPAVEGGQAPSSPAKRSTKLFLELGQVVNKIRRLSTPTQSDRSSLINFTKNERNSPNEEPSQSLRRVRSFSAVPSARLARSQHVETTLGRRSDVSWPQDVPVATSPRSNNCLSPIGHFLFPEPFNDSADLTPAIDSANQQAHITEHVLRRGHQDVESQVYLNRLNHKSSGTVTASSSLTSRRQLPGASYRRSSLHTEYTQDNSSSDTETRSLHENACASAAPRVTEHATTQVWVGASSHEQKPHTRPIPRDSVQILPARAAAPLRPLGQPLSNVEEETDDCEVTSRTFEVGQTGSIQEVDSHTAINDPLRRSESSEESLANLFRRDEPTRLQPPNVSLTVPSIIVSPSVGHRELPNPPPGRITPLEVSVDARRSRFSADATSSDEGATSSGTTRAISSTLEAAAVVAGVASSCTDDPPIDSPPLDQDTCARTRDLGYARATTTTIVEENVKDQSLSDTSGTIDSTLGVNTRSSVQTQLGRDEIDLHVSERRQWGIAVEDACVLEVRERATSPSTVSPYPGSKPRIAQLVIGRDYAEGKERKYVSMQGADGCEIEKAAVQFWDSDVIQTQPSCEEHDVFNDADIISGLSSRSGNGASDLSFTLRAQTADAATTRTSFSSQVDSQTKTSDFMSTDGRLHGAREQYHLAHKAIPPVFNEPSQVEEAAESGIEAVHKHCLPGVGYRLGEREDKVFRQSDSVQVNLSWDETTHTMPSGARQKYEVPLSTYLGPEGDANVSPAMSRERKGDGLRHQIHETRTYVHRAVEDSHVVNKLKEAKITVVDAENERSRLTPSKQESSESLVSAVLATACIAAAAFEAVTESESKDHSEHTIKHDDLNKDASDDDYPERGRITENSQTLTIEEDAIMNRAAQQIVVVESPTSPNTTMPLPSAALSEAQTRINRNTSVDIQMSRLKTGQGQERVDHVDNHEDVSDTDRRAGVYTAALTGYSALVEGANSAQRPPSAEGHPIGSMESFSRTTQTQVESVHMVQARERTQKDTDVYREVSQATQLDASREQKAALVERDLTQRASLDVNDVVTSASGTSVECSARNEQAMQEGKETSSARDVDLECASGQLSSANLAPQMGTIVVVSPQVCVDVQQTVTIVAATSDDRAKPTESISENHQGQRVEAIAVQSGEDTSRLSCDTRSTSPSRSIFVSMQEGEPTRLVKSPSAESRQSSGKAVAGNSLGSSPEAITVDTRLLTKETDTISDQPAPISIASQERPSIVVDCTQTSIRNEHTVMMITETSDDGRTSTEKLENVAHRGEQSERVGGVEGTISLQTALVEANVTIESAASQEQPRVSVELSGEPLVSLHVRNETMSSPLNANGVTGPSSVVERDRPSEGTVQADCTVLISGNAAYACSRSPSRSNCVAPHDGTVLLEDAHQRHWESVTTSSASISTYDAVPESTDPQHLFTAEMSSRWAFNERSTSDQQTLRVEASNRLNTDAGSRETDSDSALGVEYSRPAIPSLSTCGSPVDVCMSRNETFACGSAIGPLSPDTVSFPVNPDSFPGFTIANVARTESAYQQSEQNSVIATRNAVEQEADINDGRRAGYEEDVSRLQDILKAARTETIQISTTDNVALESRCRQVVEGAGGSLHIDTEYHSAECVWSSSLYNSDPLDHDWRHLSADGDHLPSNIQRPLPIGGSSTPLRLAPYSVSDSRSASHAETRTPNISQFILPSPESQSPAILHASPIDYSDPQNGTVEAPTDKIHQIVTRCVESEEHSSALAVHADRLSISTERGEAQTCGDFDPELQDTYSSASSPSPLTPSAGGEACFGKHANQVLEKYSGGHVIGLASSSLAQEERARIEHTQSTQGADNDCAWRISTWIPDSKEPPPSYQDAISDYNNSPNQSNHALPGDEKSIILDASSNDHQQQFEEGASGLEQDARRGNCRAVGESISVYVQAEDVAGAHREIMTEQVSSACNADEKHVLVLDAGVVSDGGATSTFNTSPSPRFISFHEVRTTSTTNSLEDAGESGHHEHLGDITTEGDGWNAVADATNASPTHNISAVATRGQTHVSEMDEHMTDRRTPQQSATPTKPKLLASTIRHSAAVAMQTDGKDVRKTVSCVPILQGDLAAESREGCVAEDDGKVNSEDLQCAGGVDQINEQLMMSVTSDCVGQTSSDHAAQYQTIISDMHAAVEQESHHDLTVVSITGESRIRIESADSTAKQPVALLAIAIGEDKIDVIHSSPNAHSMQVSLDYADQCLGTTPADQLAEQEEESIDTSQELTSQEHITSTASATGSNCGLLARLRHNKPPNHTMLDEARQTQLSRSRVSSIASDGTNDQDEASKTNLQGCTVRYEQPIMTTRTSTAINYYMADIENGRFDAVVWPAVIQTSQPGMNKPKGLVNVVDPSTSGAETGLGIIQTTKNVNATTSTTIIQTSSPSLNYAEETNHESTGVDLYDIAERGVFCRSLSRPFSIFTRSMQYWINRSDEAQQETTSISEGSPFSRNDHGVLGDTSESMRALVKTTRTIDVAGRSRRAPIFRGFGSFALTLNDSLAKRAAHVFDHRLFVNDHLPGIIVRTGRSASMNRPIVIVIASTNERPFGDDELIARILCCIDLDLDAPQELGLLCIVPRKTKEIMVALNDTLHAIKDCLMHLGIAVCDMSITNFDMGYWIKAIMNNSLWREQRSIEGQALCVISEAHDQREDGDAKDLASMEYVDVDASGSGVTPLSSEPNAAAEGSNYLIRS